LSGNLTLLPQLTLRKQPSPLAKKGPVHGQLHVEFGLDAHAEPQASFNDIHEHDLAQVKETCLNSKASVLAAMDELLSKEAGSLPSDSRTWLQNFIAELAQLGLLDMSKGAVAIACHSLRQHRLALPETGTSLTGRLLYLLSQWSRRCDELRIRRHNSVPSPGSEQRVHEGPSPDVSPVSCNRSAFASPTLAPLQHPAHDAAMHSLSESLLSSLSFNESASLDTTSPPTPRRGSETGHHHPHTTSPLTHGPTTALELLSANLSASPHAFCRSFDQTFNSLEPQSKRDRLSDSDLFARPATPDRIQAPPPTLNITVEESPSVGGRSRPAVIPPAMLPSNLHASLQVEPRQRGFVHTLLTPARP
jgi:hypothetical protein